MPTVKLLTGAIAAVCMAWASANATAADGKRGSPSPDNLLTTIAKRGRLRVGLSTFVPWAMRDRNGNLIGFEIDVAKKLAGDMGVDIVFVPTAWEGIVRALVAGRFDVIISGLSITVERALAVDFTRPYASSGYILVASARRADRKGLTVLEDFNEPGIVIAARRASTCAAAIRKHFPKATLVGFDDDTLAYRETVNGGVDGVCSTPPPAAFEIDRHGAALHVYRTNRCHRRAKRSRFARETLRRSPFSTTGSASRKYAAGKKRRYDYWFTTREWGGDGRDRLV